MKYRDFILVVNLVFYIFIYFYFFQIISILKYIWEHLVVFHFYIYFVILLKEGMSPKEAWDVIFVFLTYIVALPSSYLTGNYFRLLTLYLYFFLIFSNFTYNMWYHFFKILYKIFEYLILNDFFMIWARRLFLLYLFFLAISYFMFFHYFSFFSEEAFIKLVSNPNYDASWAYGLIMLFIISSCYLVGGCISLLIIIGILGFLDFSISFIRKQFPLKEADSLPEKEEKGEI